MNFSTGSSMCTSKIPSHTIFEKKLEEIVNTTKISQISLRKCFNVVSRRPFWIWTMSSIFEIVRKETMSLRFLNITIFVKYNVSYTRNRNFVVNSGEWISLLKWEECNENPNFWNFGRNQPIRRLAQKLCP